MLKQIIALRKDLNMRKGKMAAQAAHASMMFISDSFLHKAGHHVRGKVFVPAIITEEQQEWLQGLFTKIVLGVSSEDELLALYYRAIEEGLVAHVAQDAGLTEFKNEDGSPKPTYTAVAIGPHDSSALDPLTGHLKLL